MLDQALQEIERKWKASGLPGLYENATGPEARERAIIARRDFYPKPHIEVGSILDAVIPRPDGVIPVQVIRPRTDGATATVVYFHGGGWIVGDLDSHQAHAARIANLTDSIVVNVGYRLAPEDPFPAGVDDAIVATKWVHDRIKDYGGDADKLAVAGDSAGGNLAAVVAVHCRDHGLKLAAQLLIYPATNLTESPDKDVVGKYLGDDFTNEARDPRASPALTENLSGLAPAIIGVGVYDFLYKDNMAYAELLRESGVKLTLREYPTLNHGFFSYTAVSEASKEAANQLCADLRKFLHG
ncbi:Acetyl esterase/lipase [Rhizobiales bacterium GAS113]|nr:Acetyl esterase/lipase [Rhizobiales bacterium GAS113]